MPSKSFGAPKKSPLILPDRWYELRPHSEQSRLWTSPARFKVVPAGRRSGKCLAAGTLITMANGTQKPIEKIKIGDMVLSANPMYILEPKAVTNIISNGIKPTIEIRLANPNRRYKKSKSYIQTYATHEHPFWVNKKWTKAKDIRHSDLMAVNKSKFPEAAYLPITKDDILKSLNCDLRERKNREGQEDDGPLQLNLWLREYWGHHSDRLSVKQFNDFYPYIDQALFAFFLEGDITWAKVTLVKPAGERETYNLTIEDNKNFLANGMVSHNTELAKRKIILRCINPWDTSMPLPSRTPPPGPNSEKGQGPRYFMGAPTWQQAKRIYWSDLKAMVPDWAFDGTRRQAVSESDLCIRFKSGAELWVVGMDKPERIEGSPWDGGVLDEYGNMKSRTWPEHVRPALSDRKGWCDFIGVPEGRNHYYDISQYAKKVAQEAERLGKMPEWDNFHWISADILDADEISSAREFLDALTFAQEYEGDFTHFQGRAYYPFNERLHCRPLQYNPKLPLIFCFDFNINPGVAVVCQEQLMPEVVEVCYDKQANREYSKPVIGTGIIGEVYIPQNSNTVAVCNRLLYDWHNHDGEIHIYGDATGGTGGSAQTEGSDWDIVRKVFHGKWNNKIYYFLPTGNPKERVRVNAMNSRLMSVSGVIRMMIDRERAPNTVKDLEGTRILEGGSGELDKKATPELTHLTDGLGYYIVYRFPIEETQGKSFELLW